ncbi:MAG TPA: hypothetical protein VMF13_06835 [Luteitalea sp.]|nr:hypothetical protein [Luteitalea sp.]
MMRTLALVMALGVSVPAMAQAQEPTTPPKIQAPDPDGRHHLLKGLAIGPGVDVIAPTSGKASVAVVPRLSIRFPSEGGWAPTVGFGWFNTGIDGTEFGRDERMGELQLRPVMVGARYSWLRGAYSFDVAATAGPSFSDFDLDGEIARSFFPGQEVTAEASTSLATKVQGGVWYDYSDRVAFRGTIGYFRCSPEITVTAGGQGRRFTQSANAIQFGASVVYRIF